ncbi:16S rRNA (cytosine(1402)-N(4))-methyltransferase RsmH [Clostridium botulinum]|uniref:Ribosomal RNA small subunit methyltransferase H n=1 Tax=Clostridium botulinum D str. 1873 TaxID=592027 RepID=A0A9P2G6I2_CLOBO|nr:MULTISPECIES: 16S rRNA (cytosine(1402)-N(4))-methyltransferase RsmH [Clostridium]AYF54981.1 16S rRNA (cytosine(1402)-N(4))-methyltransferase RsmH [Clostridium novyi]EES90824.1 S-adenosyl-methyltransferase MraW [Clostridium botulinum D str. 1873]MBO3441924.1 16S rRNA (cytosine(1402)-N(4))-methyltransferase RsmH [Clostridium haemolyticum]MCD3244416.1 16S rRNA (cytosine(1402)-N(4))-methyltransferase RsmH [Clostridium botulinum C]MCD3260974.1 16S rRNA (cytosine(1402)-N(4))-methyltransferase Rsm
MDFNHVPVLLEETIDSLNIKEDGIYVDCTLGGAGHSSYILKRLSKKGKLIGIDQDINALKAAKEKLKNYDNVIYVHNNFYNLASVLDELNIEKVDGILMDLGVSSYQLDTAERGFSYMQDAVLDMRMNTEESVSAYNIVNEYSEEELFRIIKEYGEERFARKIAKAIVKQREIEPVKTTLELVKIIKKVIPMKFQQGGHPAKKTFQAIRIEVNHELEILNKTIEDGVKHLNSHGRISIITFHSLEDRIVKNKFKELENPCTCPKEFPICICGMKPVVKVITRKPLEPSQEEKENNSRSKSSKLRVAQRI